MDAFTYAARATFRNNGGTFNLDGQPVFHTKGYYVGGIVPTLTMSTGTSRSSLAEKLAVLATKLCRDGYNDGSVYLGTWVDRDIVYIDASEWYDDVNVALTIARQLGELAIWGYQVATSIELTPARD